MDAPVARLVTGARDDDLAGGNRDAAQRRVVALLDGREERVDVDMQQRSARERPDEPVSLARQRDEGLRLGIDASKPRRRV